MRDVAKKRIGHLYPKVEVTAEMAKERPDLRPYVGRKLTVIAWLWSRTVKSPNPAFAHVDVPLASVPAAVVTSDFGPVEVPTDSLWVMGDNRQNSADSRSFGAIETDSIVGRAIVRMWPVTRLAFL